LTTNVKDKAKKHPNDSFIDDSRFPFFSFFCGYLSWRRFKSKLEPGTSCAVWQRNWDEREA
jgi:hypothetical protein